MKYTNKYNLPSAFVRAVMNDPYDKGASDFSATGLATPPRAYALMLSHGKDAVTDVSSRVASIIGQGAHSIAERAARPEIDICEKRFFADFIVDGKKYVVSSQVDLFEQDTGTLMDWKTAKAYAFSKKTGSGRKPEWVQQLNIGAEILRRNGHQPRALSIVAMLKDWRFETAGEAGMPESEVIAVDIPMWTPEKVVSHIETRIRLFQAAKEVLPECTEHWGGRRCERWCEASAICEQYQKTIQIKKGETA
jgi:hypothetical protein